MLALVPQGIRDRDEVRAKGEKNRFVFLAMCLQGFCISRWRSQTFRHMQFQSMMHPFWDIIRSSSWKQCLSLSMSALWIGCHCAACILHSGLRWYNMQSLMEYQVLSCITARECRVEQLWNISRSLSRSVEYYYANILGLEYLVFAVIFFCICHSPASVQILLIHWVLVFPCWWWAIENIWLKPIHPVLLLMNTLVTTAQCLRNPSEPH